MEGYFVGKVSSIDESRGFVKVTYPEENNIVSDWLPMLWSEYDMPSIGTLVATVLGKNLSGICLGKIYSYSQPPKDEIKAEFGKYIYGVSIKREGNSFKIDFGNGANLTAEDGVITIRANEIILDGYKG